MSILQTYQIFANAASELAGSDSFAHVNAGLAIYIGVQLVLRTRRASLFALNVVLAAELANEVIDRLLYGSWRLDDTLTDMLATLFWPVLLYAVSRYRRHRWAADQLRAARFKSWMRPGRRRMSRHAGQSDSAPERQPA